MDAVRFSQHSPTCVHTCVRALRRNATSPALPRHVYTRSRYRCVIWRPMKGLALTSSATALSALHTENELDVVMDALRRANFRADTCVSIRRYRILKGHRSVAVAGEARPLRHVMIFGLNFKVTGRPAYSHSGQMSHVL